MGCAEAGRWRIPLILRLSPDVQVEDIRSVLTAVTNHHDALRLRIVQRAGTWEQHIGEPQEFAELATRSLPDGISPASPQEREAVLDILNEQIRGHDLLSPPLTATYVRGVPGGPCYLAISVHAIVGDTASRDILLTDIFTAFGQRLAGEDIALQPATMSWREWSQRCAALATHPAVVESREFWQDTVTRAALRVAGPLVSEPPGVDDLVKLSSTLTTSETSEIDDARRRLRVPIDEILLAALGRTIAATVGDGAVAVDLGGPGRSVLKPDVDLRRTVGWFTTVYPVALSCSKGDDSSARQQLDDVHNSVQGRPALRNRVRTAALHVRTNRAAARRGSAGRHLLLVPGHDPGAAGRACRRRSGGSSTRIRRCRCARRSRAWVTPSNSGYIARLVSCTWIGGTTPAGSSRQPWNRLPGNSPPRSIELTREAITEDEMDSVSDELALVDLSSTDAGIGEANAQHR